MNKKVTPFGLASADITSYYVELGANKNPTNGNNDYVPMSELYNKETRKLNNDLSIHKINKKKR